MNDRQIDRIVERVVERLERDLKGAAPATARPTVGTRFQGHTGHGIFTTVEDAAAAATKAFGDLSDCSLDTRKKAVAGMRAKMMEHREELSRMAVEETGLGRVTDKIGKNELAAMKTPGPEILEPKAWSDDDGLALLERAPYGVIGSITPCTNASETIINNAISMFSGGNTAIFNVHPTAKGVCNYTVGLLNDAIVAAGGPSNTLCSIDSPTIQSAGELMHHKSVRLLAVTGGPGVVKAAMNSGKRAIAAGGRSAASRGDRYGAKPRSACRRPAATPGRPCSA